VQAWYPAWNSYYSYNAPAWSISAEWAFYLCFPLLIADWRRTWHLKLAATFALALGTVVVCNGLQLPFQAPGSWRPEAYGWVYANPTCNLFAFTVGVALVPAFRRLRAWRCGPAAGTALELLALATVARSVVMSFVWSQRFIILHCPSLGAAGLQWLVQGTISLPAFALLILVMGLGRGWCSRVLGCPAMVLLGEISFSLYLVHAPLRKWYLANYEPACYEPNLFAYVGWLALSLGLAYLNWRLVERPCRKLLIGLWSRPATPPTPAVARLPRAA
jgi:peptidoglycan/LPS O-acetylase OafA/YrhL